MPYVNYVVTFSKSIETPEAEIRGILHIDLE